MTIDIIFDGGGPADGRILTASPQQVAEWVAADNEGFLLMPACAQPGGQLAIYESNGPVSEIETEVCVSFAGWWD